MKKYKYKHAVSFNTKYKRGDYLYCIKDVVFDDKILFHQGETYVVNKIEYSMYGDCKTTQYQPFYIMNEKYAFFSPNEKFTINEESHGGIGMSGYGRIDEHFKKKD